MSFNIQSYSEVKADSKNLTDFIESCGSPDIICSQEDMYFINMDTKGYDLIQACEGEEYRSAVMSNNILMNKNSTLEKISSEAISLKGMGRVYRCCSIIIVKLGNVEIKIANVHLSGGRYDDQQFNNELYSSIKNEQMQQVINANPDIIVGDFNSYFLNDDIDSLLTEYYIYQQAIQRNLKNEYIKWATSVHQILLDSNYIPANLNVGDTTMFGGTVDWIYYNNNDNKFKSIKVEKHLAMTGTKPPYTPVISDHNALVATVTLN